MKKAILFLLTALLLCGLFACSGAATLEPAQTVKETTQPVQNAEEAPEPAEALAFSETRARTLSPEADADTLWMGDYSFILSVLPDGQATLFTKQALLWLMENGDTFRVETRMYRTPVDETPAYVFSAGELRLLIDGETMRVEVLDDPLGVLAYAKADGRLLNKHGTFWDYAQNRSLVAQEPNTKWNARFEMAERSYAWLNLTVGNDISYTGTLSMPDGTKRNVALLGCWDSYAIVEEHDGTAELLFYGLRTNRMDPDDWYTKRMNLVRFDLEALYDPLGLCGIETFDLLRADDFDNVYADHGASEALRYMPGVNLDTVVLTLMHDGWTDKTETLDPALVGWFTLLTKDGKTLLIYYEMDFTLYGDEPFPMAYALYDADGTVLDWSGSRPIDHAIADAYTLQPGVYFGSLVSTGTKGMDVAEDDYAYFTDDGRIAVETFWHEGGDGDEDFAVIRVMP